MAARDYPAAARHFFRLSESGDAGVLLAWIEPLAAQNQRVASVHVLRGDALARTGRYEDAIEALDSAVRLDPKSALARSVRGIVRVTRPRFMYQSL